ncbi:hypothetical protein TNCV_5037681 [Trichonephila clavipes]|nr:hypothetical protein TNCV_5037681 [Trichonephila clavipes]
MVHLWERSHFARACLGKSLNNQNSPKNKFSSPVKAQKNSDKLKCLDVFLDGTVDSRAQISVVRSDLVKEIESTEEGKIMKLVNDMLGFQTAHEALLENIQLCSVNARQVINDEVQLDESKNSITCEVQTFEDGSCSDIEVTTGAVDIENELRANLSSETRKTFIKLQKEDETLISVWEQANKKEKVYEIQDYLLVHNDLVVEQSSKLSYMHVKERKFYDEILTHEIPLAGQLGEQKNQATDLIFLFLAFVKNEHEDILRSM